MARSRPSRLPQFTTREVAAILGLKHDSLRSYCFRHHIGTILGNTRLLSQADIEELKLRPPPGRPRRAQRP